MKLIFNGETSQIDVNTLIVALGHYQSIVSEANKEMGATKTVELKINAIEKGSFVVDLSVAESAVKQLFSGETVGFIASICTLVGSAYTLYKYFKGRAIKSEKDKTDAKTIIKGDNNIVINAINLYNSPATREAISKTIQAAKNDESVSGITIEADNREDVSFPRENFDEYIHDSFSDEEMLPPDKIETKRANLFIVSLSFEEGNSWQFMYEGFKISVRVRDNALMKLVDEGERFGKGDSIEVDLQISQKYNPLIRCYENKSFKIVGFYAHHDAPSQPQLF